MQALRIFSRAKNFCHYRFSSRSIPYFGRRGFSNIDASQPTTPGESKSSITETAETLRKELAAKETQLKELKDSYLLCLADMENLRQRTKREVEAASIFAIQRFCKDIISIADVLEMALSSSTGQQSTKSATEEILDVAKQYNDMMGGLRMTLEELHKVFTKYGVNPIDPLHQRFDPNLHNALYEVPTAEVEPGVIVNVQKKGYLLHQRVIRPADVGVARKP